MNRSIKDIYWLAGLLDGEGCFLLREHYVNGIKYSYPRIAIKITDRDTIEKVKHMMGTNTKISIIREKYALGKKDIYQFQVAGRKAAGWMMTLYPLMSQRRKWKIREILISWTKSVPFALREVS